MPAAPCYWVAYSGGIDSSVLLAEMLAARADLECRRLVAVHVNHRQSEEAEARASFCARTCAELAIELQVLRVEGSIPPGASPEAWLRRQRYRLLAGIMTAGDLMFVAQHADDQAETLLLQLLRGAGPHGLAGMPRMRPLGAGLLVRPFLELSRGEIEARAAAAGLRWCEDPSNLDVGLDRNFLRHEILPGLKTRWPAAARTLARAAQWQAEAAELLDRAGARDYRRCCREGQLSVSRLLELPRNRQQAVLRYQLQRNELRVPGNQVIVRLLDELCAARADAEPCVRWDNVEARRYRDRLYFQPVAKRVRPERPRPWDPARTLRLPHGTLSAHRVRGLGIRETAVAGAELTLRFRAGGERLRLPGRRHRSSLKKLLQAWRVPPWLRDGIPLVYRGGELICVVGYTVAEGYRCPPDEPGWLPLWQPEETAGSGEEAGCAENEA